MITRAASSPARTMATAADRFNINSQLEHLQTRYVGTGHADTNRFEWAVNIHRDSYASYFGRHSMLQYFALAENESIGRVRYNMMQVRERERPPPRERGVTRGVRCPSPPFARNPRWPPALALANNPKRTRSTCTLFSLSSRRSRSRLTPVTLRAPAPQRMLLPCGLPPEREEE